MNVKRLDGPLLNLWVAKSAGLQLAADGQGQDLLHDPDNGLWHPRTYDPAHDWSQGGPIIAGDWYAIEDMLLDWFGAAWPQVPALTSQPLKWFLRAYVATQYGNEVEDVEIVHAWPTAPRDEAPISLLPMAAAGSGVPGWLRLFDWAGPARQPRS
jgi:hypothetical protein